MLKNNEIIQNSIENEQNEGMRAIDVTIFEVKNDEYGTWIFDQYDGKIYLIDWENGSVTIGDFWDAELIYDVFPIERWFEMLLRREE